MAEVLVGSGAVGDWGVCFGEDLDGLVAVWGGGVVEMGAEKLVLGEDLLEVFDGVVRFSDVVEDGVVPDVEAFEELALWALGGCYELAFF